MTDRRRRSRPSTPASPSRTSRRTSARACARSASSSGLSLRELARRIGVSASLISQIERDKVNPSVSTLYALVRELGLAMGDLFSTRAPSARSSARAAIAARHPRRSAR